MRLAAALVLCAGCAAPSGGGNKHVSVPFGAPVSSMRGVVAQPASDAQATPIDVAPVVREADKHIGATSVRVNGQSFRYDCSGFVRGVYSALGADLFALGAQMTDANGVKLIYAFLERYGENHKRPRPNVGDVIYWDDTVDKNNDGAQNDPLTHVGLVVGVEEDGTVQFIHRSNKGIVKEVMNVLRPAEHRDASGKKLNDYLRGKKRREPEGARHLSGELWAGFGTLSRIPAPQKLALLASSFRYWPREE